MRLPPPGAVLFIAALALPPSAARAAGPKPAPATLSRLIDDAVQKRLDTEKLKASPLASDAEFLRRASLDIGRTDKTGAAVEERPVSTADFFATVCELLGIDYQTERDTPGGRPLPRVEKSGKPVRKLYA